MNFSTRALLGLTTFLMFAAPTVMCSVSEAASYNSITLTWTAPGDDGSTGQASQYDVRYSTSTISGTDTTTWWSAATQCTGESTPQTAGTTETFTVTGLTASRTYYFMIKTADEVPNWSGFSNIVARATSAAPDTIPPAAIRNLAELEKNITGRGDFLLVLADAYASVASETQGRVSSAQEDTEILSGWPIVLLEPARDQNIFGGAA